jgi:hypothetical protein
MEKSDALTAVTQIKRSGAFWIYLLEGKTSILLRWWEAELDRFCDFPNPTVPFHPD